jgi:tetratricopeptide (TPR) repeat protein
LIAVFLFNHREARYKNALAAPHPPNAEAQELYLKGQYHWTKRTPEDLNKALDYFTQSIVKDPSYAQAYVGLANCYNLLREFSVMPPDEAFPRALAAAQKAVELDDTSAGAHNSLAFATYYWDWDQATAEREYKRALELDPNFVQGHHWYATFLLTAGRFPEALDQIEQARKLDPSSTTIQADKGFILFSAGHKSEAFALLKRLESTDPALASTHRYLASSYFDRKDYENFFAESKQAAQLRRDDAALAIVTAAERGFAAGGVKGMRESTIPVRKEMVDRDLSSAYELAATCALVGKKEAALRYLHVAYEKREALLLNLYRDPDFSTVRNDLVYKEITERVGERLSGRPQQ